MKTNVLIGGLLICGMASCVSKYKVATSISADGSCLREVYANCDSAFIAGNLKHNPYMFRLDSTWQVTPLESAEQDKKRSKSYYAKVGKTFRAIDEISAGLQLVAEEARPLAAPTETFQKRFRWFYTYYTFKAVFPGIADKIPTPIDSDMTKDEQMLWLRGDFSAYRGMNGMELNDELDEMEKHFLTWHARNIYEANFEAVCDFENRLGGSPYASQLAAAEDSLFMMLAEKEKLIESKKADAIYHALDRYFKTSYFSDLYKKNERQIDSLCAGKRKYIQSLVDDLFAKDVEYVLTMPGKLVDANAPWMAQDTLRWKVTAVRLLPGDYELTATSRTANSWAFAVALLLIALSAYCTVRVKHFAKVKR
ncbi:MAG: hypothetical protein LBO71_09560 [Prevotellaceae bacterium]|jgi:hypothetical protein|nr:hypothetical protein [Prevotellaceae bacterium]